MLLSDGSVGIGKAIYRTDMPLMPPIGRRGHAERDIGAAALFLAGPSADYITSQNINVDGGSSRR